MKILLTGGGTGGHIYPALAIWRYLLEQYPQAQFIYVGTSHGLEAQIVPREKIVFKTVSSSGLSRKISSANLIALLKVSKGLLESFQIIKRFKPDVVVGTGGYVCGPVVLMASMLGIPTLIHEQNAFPGITNKLLARKAKMVCLTFAESQRHFTKYQSKLRLTGLPVRPQLLQVDKTAALAKLGLDPQKFTLLVVGGSQGAVSINKAMYQVISYYQHDNGVQVMMITGNKNYDSFNAGLKEHGVTIKAGGNIIIKPYLDEMEYGLGAADLVVARAGATFIAEITAIGIPAILIPYPYASENHQEYNAQSVVNSGGALMIKDKDLTGPVILEQIKSLFSSRELLKQMAENSKRIGKPQAVVDIASSIVQLAQKKGE